MKLDDKTLRAAVKQADRRYYDLVQRMAAQHSADAAARKGRHLMKKFGKLAIIGAAAAVLLTAGGITAMVAMRGQNHDTSDTSGFDSSLPEGTERAFHLNLTDQQWDAANRMCYSFSPEEWIVPTENGIYHPYSEQVCDPDNLYDEAFNQALQSYRQLHALAGIDIPAAIHYTAAGQSESIPLCSRPNCLHDGNEYCEATSRAYDHTGLVCWDGVLYAAATRSNYGKSQSEYTAKTGAYLLSYAPDGTGFDVVCDFGIEAARPCCEPIVHRGYVWCVFAEYQLNSAGDPAHQGYAIVGYELATGKTVEVCRLMPEEGELNYEMPESFTACGDKLLYTQQGASWQSSQKYANGLFAVDLTTGKHEKLVRLDGPIAAAGDRIYYIDSEASQSCFMVYDMKTGESKKSMKRISYYVVSDGEHLIFAGIDPADDDDYAVMIYDLDGNLLGALKMSDHSDLYNIALYGDDIYVLARNDRRIDTDANTDDVLLHCSKSALLAGNAEWTEQATLVRRIDLDTEKWRGAQTEQ